MFTASLESDLVHIDASPVHLDRVSRSYGRGDHRVHALRDASLTCPPRSWTAVMGPSGSGKSTLLHCAAGLERVDSGQVVLAGQDVTRASEQTLTRLRRQDVGFVFQSFNLMGALTAAQNVALPFRLSGQRPPRGRVKEVLTQVGLGDRARHRPRELSGGQQQRVALARALVTRPAVLFADEPTGALDSRSAREVLELLRSMVDIEGQAIVMVTHDPVAASYADGLVFLADGRIVDQAPRSSASQIAERLSRMGG